MAHIRSQHGVGHNPCYTHNKIGAITGGSGSMEMAAVHSVHVVLHAAVFQIIDIPTQGKEYISDIAHMHTQLGLGHNYATHSLI